MPGCCCRGGSRPRAGRSGSTRRICTTGSTTASPASARSSRSTPRSACGRDNTDAPQILCGDFNATPDSDEIRFLRGLTTLDGRRTHFQDAWLRLHREAAVGDGPEDGITWSAENELTRPMRSLDIDRRIDYVFATSRKKDGRGTVRRCEVVLRERDGGICASDHYGVLGRDVQVVAELTGC